MSDEQYVIVDGIKWYVYGYGSSRYAQALCPIHGLRLRTAYPEVSHELDCADCRDSYRVPRTVDEEKSYVLDKIDSILFKSTKFINLDDEAVPIAEDKIPANSKFFVTSVLTKSKVGLRLVVYAGKKGEKAKTQIFVEPDIKRLAFDQKDLHPNDVFTKVEAQFADGTKAELSK